MAFEIKCKTCGSTDCIIETRVDYDWDETPCYDGTFIYCNDCGNEQRV